MYKHARRVRLYQRNIKIDVTCTANLDLLLGMLFGLSLALLFGLSLALVFG